MVKFATFKSLLILALVVVANSAFAQFDDMPPQPGEYGKCYAKCKVPDQYETVEKQVLVKEASTKLMTIPAEYETVTEQVLVKEASKKLVPVPAEYETITEQVVVKEASTRTRTSPAEYRTVTEKMLVKEASGKWVKKRRAPNCFSANPEDCYVMCWEEVPAEYKTVSKQVLARPAETQTTEIPAEYKTVTRRVLKRPATVDEVDIPAEYKTITRQVLKVPERTDEVVIPAEYKTVTEKQLVKTGGFTRWTEILCAEKTTSNKVVEVQRALASRGYDVGPIDGVLGGRTKSALESYQRENGLPVGNLNIETLQSLGISY